LLPSKFGYQRADCFGSKRLGYEFINAHPFSVTPKFTNLLAGQRRENYRMCVRGDGIRPEQTNHFRAPHVGQIQIAQGHLGLEVRRRSQAFPARQRNPNLEALAAQKCRRRGRQLSVVIY
jgi:hypothetical protein